MEVTYGFKVGDILIITSGSKVWGVVQTTLPPPSSSKGESLDSYIGSPSSGDHTIVVGHRGHLWSHQGAPTIFKGDWHH